MTCVGAQGQRDLHDGDCAGGQWGQPHGQAQASIETRARRYKAQQGLAQKIMRINKGKD
jgi:hypothetical protein